MLHQPADHFAPTTPPTVFDAEAYVRDMRAAGVGLVEMGDSFCLKPAGHGFKTDYSAAQARWHGLVDEDAQRRVAGILVDERGASESRALIGDDVIKGLSEVRRLHDTAMTAYAAEQAVIESFAEAEDQIDDRRMKAASAAADEAGHYYHYAIMHVAALPGGTLTELAAKAQFALDERDYSSDFDLVGDTLKEVVAFLTADLAVSFLQTAE